MKQIRYSKFRIGDKKILLTYPKVPEQRRRDNTECITTIRKKICYPFC